MLWPRGPRRAPQCACAGGFTQQSIRGGYGKHLLLPFDSLLLLLYLILYYSRCSPNVLTFCFLFSACRLFHSSYCFFFLLLVGAITTLTGPGTITVCLECFLVPTYAPNFLLLFFYLMPADCFVHSLQG